MSHATVRPNAPAPTSTSQLPLPVLLDAWVAEGIISHEQADRIRVRQEAEPATTAMARPALALEALGYLGGVIVVVAALLLGFRLWDELGQWTRLGLVGGAALVLLAGGAVVPARAGDAGARLRAVLWLAATGAFAGFLAVLGTDVLDLDDGHVGVLTTTGAAVLAFVLWVVRRTAVQQLAMMIGAMIAAGVALADLSSSQTLPGLGAWCVAAIWAVLAWGGILPHRRLSLGVAAAGMIVGSLTTIPNDAGIVLALATVGSVVLAAVLFRDLVLLAIGALGTLNVLPAAITEWFPNTVAVPVALLALGIALVAMALWAARHGRTRPTGPTHDWSTGSPRLAVTIASVLLGVLLAMIITTAAVG